MKYKWLLFDADGTLYDYDAAEAMALCESLKFYDIDFTSECHMRYRQINSQLFKEYEQGVMASSRLRVKRFELLFEEYDIELDAHVFANLYLSKLSSCSILIPGALDIIRKLGNDYQMAIVTNGIADVQRKRFDKSEIKQYFSRVIISDEIGVAKPDGRFFDAAFMAIGYPDKKDVIIIGDSLTSDIAGGINYGIDTCWFNPLKASNKDNVKMTYEITALSELAGVL